MIAGLVGKAAGMVVGGLAGAVAYDGVKRIVRSTVVRDSAVTVTSWGLRGARVVETGAERARLGAADIVSEARERIGEQAQPPAGSGHGHQH